MKKDILDKKFRHHSWFKQGVTVRYALDHFARSKEAVLGRKRSRKQSNELFAPIEYDEVLTDGKMSYKICEEEKEYYLERKKYWDEQKEIEKQKWLDSEVNFDKEVKILASGYTDWDITHAEKQLNFWKNIDKDNDVEAIAFWENELNEILRKKPIIENFIKKAKDNTKTNRDFLELEKKLNELKKTA